MLNVIKRKTVVTSNKNNLKVHSNQNNCKYYKFWLPIIHLFHSTNIPQQLLLINHYYWLFVYLPVFLFLIRTPLLHCNSKNEPRHCCLFVNGSSCLCYHWNGNLCKKWICVMWRWVDQCAFIPANYSAPCVNEEGSRCTASWTVYKKINLWGRPMPFHDSLLIFN